LSKLLKELNALKYSYVARQPIFDSERNAVAYELLFRDGPKNTFPDVEAELATSRLLSDQFLSVHYKSLGKKRGYVNFPQQSLINQIPALFPSNSIVVEILEDCEPSDELLTAIKELYKKGYTLALDDFVPSPGWLRFLPFISIIKFDIRTVPIGKAAFFMTKLKKSKIQFLAEKVENYEEFKQAKEVGFTLFQGYFFAKPEVIQQRAIEPSLLTVVQLCKEIANEDINYAEIERLVSTDLSLSYKLLRYVNSSSMISSEIKSFKQALVYLGEDRLKKFVSLVAVSNTNEGKPNSLYTLSISRARFCELLARKSNGKIDGSLAFLTGMFSLLDSLLDQTLETIMDSIPVDHSIKAALLEGSGELGKAIQLVRAFERANWEEVIKLRNNLGIPEDHIADCYHQAQTWAQDLIDL